MLSFRLLLLSAIVLLVAARSGGKARLDRIKVNPDTGHFLDTEGRVRVFHGLNAVFKEPPFYPPFARNGTGTCKANPRYTMCPEEISQLYNDWGFNVIRLGVLWNAVQPAEGEIDHAYLSTMKDLIEQLAAHGIYTIVDAHQDAMGSLFCGEGVPNWVVSKALALAKWNSSDPRTASRSFPYPFKFNISIDKTTGYPNHTDCMRNNFFAYYFTVESSAAWQSLYNEPELWAHFGQSWAAVAAALSSVDKVLAYELINEPPPGDLYKFWKDPLHPARFLSDEKNLAAMYNAVHEHIRREDNDTIVMFESVVLDTYLGILPLRSESDFVTSPGGPAYTDRAVYSYHLYCTNDDQGRPSKMPFCKDLLQNVWKGIQPTIKRLNTGAFLTEMGASGVDADSRELLQAVLDQADDGLQSWAYWTYKDFHDITTQNAATETLYNADGSLQIPKLKTLSRTYAPAIAGQEIKMNFDPSSATFTLDYVYGSESSGAVAVVAPTSIFLNEDLYYPNGFNVTVRPAAPSTSWRQVSKNYIEVHHDGLISGGEHQISIVVTALE